MRNVIAKAAIFPLFYACTAFADTGPCKPYPPLEVLVCGDGAAIVIHDTISPSKKFALAWRNVEAPPPQEPEGQIDLVILRLEDGGILSRTSTEYWARARHMPTTSASAPTGRPTASF